MEDAGGVVGLEVGGVAAAEEEGFEELGARAGLTVFSADADAVMGWERRRE